MHVMYDVSYCYYLWISQLLMDKAQGKKLGMKLLNGLQQQSSGSTSRRPSKPNASSSNQELYELMITNYEDRIKVRDDLWPLVTPCISTQELQLENTSLRETIAVMDKELVALLNMQKTRMSMVRTASHVYVQQHYVVLINSIQLVHNELV